MIHDLGQGGAEKVLVNLVNNMNSTVFDITVMSLFGGGVNERCLKPHINYTTVFNRSIPGNSRLMKLFTPETLHRFCIKEHYDIEISYLEGPCARIISGCSDDNTKTISWIHTKFQSEQDVYSPFRNKNEANKCYQRFDFTAFVSKDVGDNFCNIIPLSKANGVLYNTIETESILEQAKEPVNIVIDDVAINIISVGSLKQVKGYDRLLRIAKKLKEDRYKYHLYILGRGPLETEFRNYINENDLAQEVSLLGFDSNPYKYVAKCDLYVCSSYTEGFSTAVTESLIVGTPVCTVDVSGMTEMLGNQNEFGLVTENSEEALYNGIKSMLDSYELIANYKEKAVERRQSFSKDRTVGAVENTLLNL